MTLTTRFYGLSQALLPEGVNFDLRRATLVRRFAYRAEQGALLFDIADRRPGLSIVTVVAAPEEVSRLDTMVETHGGWLVAVTA
jgi:hypothetical protein